MRRDHPGGLTSTLGPSEEKDAGSLDPLLLSVLSESRDLGFLGPGPVDEQVRHSLLFALMVPAFSGRAVDLGSGGGLPGLVLARHWPASSWLFLDINRRRTEWLAGAVSSLGMADRVKVRCQRAEEAGRDPLLRSSFDLVTARSFGPPAVTAECAAPLLSMGGLWSCPNRQGGTRAGGRLLISINWGSLWMASSFRRRRSNASVWWRHAPPAFPVGWGCRPSGRCFEVDPSTATG